MPLLGLSLPRKVAAVFTVELAPQPYPTLMKSLLYKELMQGSRILCVPMHQLIASELHELALGRVRAVSARV